MPLKPCLDCGRLSRASRCPIHTLTTTQRGLGWAHQQQRAKQIEDVPYCQRCGHPGSPGNPLTGEHGRPRAHGGRDVDRTLCRSCNSSTGATVRRGD